MKGKCCGVRLERTTSDTFGFRMKEHRWKCTNCGHTYVQRLRKANDKEAKETLEVVTDLGSMEVEKDNWPVAERAVAMSNGTIALSPARGPGMKWKRLYVVEGKR